MPVTLCTANVEFEIDDTIFESRVAASLLPKNEGEAGHSGDTPDTQSSSLEDAEVALNADEVVDASQSIHDHSEDAQV